MTEFENIVIDSSAILSLIVTVILMVAIPVAFFIYWRKKHKQQTKISYLIAGAVGFIVSARVLELGVHLVCIVAEEWFMSSTLFFSQYINLTFEFCMWMNCTRFS